MAFENGGEKAPVTIQSIAAVGGLDQDIALKAEAIYLQKDPRWGKDGIGGSNEPMSAVGCTITSVSMGLAEFEIDILPGDLNQRLKDINAYTSEGWLIWNKINEVSDGKVETVIPANPSYELIDNALLAGQPVIANVTMNGQFLHWILIVGKSGQEYLVKDPLGKQKIEKLSKFNSPIYAIRILRATQKS